jgi:hypothetical protein
MAKRDIKAILKKSKLSGKEAGALLIRNFVETDHHRPAILTGAEIQRLRSKVSNGGNEQDIEDFNSYMHLYRIVGYTLKEAEVLHLRILLGLSNMASLIQPFLTDHWLRMAAGFIPFCVTEKQLEDLKKERLQELHCMAEVIDARAGNLSEGQWWSTESSEEEDAAILEEATRQIAQALEEHDLEPVRLEERADETEREDIEPENLHLYLTGEQLYQTGLPEWQRWIDRLDVSFDRREHLNLSLNRTGEVAIVQNPYEVDDRGWYVEKWRDMLSTVRPLARMAEEAGLDMRQTLEIRHKSLRKQLRVFLAHQPVLEALSEVVGVKLHEDLEEWLADIQEEVASYTDMLSADGLNPPPHLKEHFEKYRPEVEAVRPDLPTFTIEDLKPDRRHVQHLKERMAMALTAEEQFEAFSEWLTERSEEIDEIEDSLAEEVSGHED